MINKEEPCIKGCGFYGNPEWNGYCSVCRLTLNKKVEIIHNRNINKEDCSFDQMNIKNQLRKKDKNLKTSDEINIISNSESHINANDKSIFNISATSISQVVQKFFNKSKPSLNNSPYKEFVRILTHPSSIEVYRKITNFMDEIKIDLLLTVDEKSEKILNFYSVSLEWLQTLVPYKDCNQEQLEILSDCIERFVMNMLYDCIICKISQTNPKDVELNNKMKNLEWIKLEHFSLKLIKFDMKSISDFFNAAKESITRFLTRPSPIDKLNHLTIASRLLLKILKISNNGLTPNADEFLPFLIFLLIRTCPSLLNSSITYIMKFSHPNRLIRGEPAYYFTTLCVAVEFIENINEKSLSISREEFYKNMGKNYDKKSLNDITINNSILGEPYSYEQFDSSIDLLKHEFSSMKLKHESIENNANRVIKSMDNLKCECKNNDWFLP